MGGREGVTWLPDSCIECRPAVGLLPVRVCVEEIEGKEGRERRGGTQSSNREMWSVVVPYEEAWMTQAASF